MLYIQRKNAAVTFLNDEIFYNAYALTVCRGLLDKGKWNNVLGEYRKLLLVGIDEEMLFYTEIEFNLAMIELNEQENPDLNKVERVLSTIIENDITTIEVKRVVKFILSYVCYLKNPIEEIQRSEAILEQIFKTKTTIDIFKYLENDTLPYFHKASVELLIKAKNFYEQEKRGTKEKQESAFAVFSGLSESLVTIPQQRSSSVAKDNIGKSIEEMYKAGRKILTKRKSLNDRLLGWIEQIKNR